jgi:phosphoglycolate phosphatase-like HAD superfamily hydrolase
MPVSNLLVLDFDGVICDSIDECFASSWTAYHTLFRKDAPADPSPEVRRGFTRCRPFIRTGEDFLIIQEALAATSPVRDQAGFDELSRRAGPDKRARFRELFYQARSELLTRDRESWLSLNKVYPHMKKAFTRMAGSAPVLVLSTKKPRFIAEILSANDISLPPERILLSDGEPKLVATERLRADGGFESAILIDDQIDHLRENKNDRVRGLLAAWGYVQENWLSAAQRAVPIITAEGFLVLVEEGFSSG